MVRWYGAARVYRYEEYTSEATLNDLSKNQVVWTGTLGMLGAQSLPRALNEHPFDVIREHDSRPCAEEHTNGQQRRKQA